MKKIRLFTLALLIIGFGLSTYAGDGGKFGFRGGFQYSNIYKDGSAIKSDPLNSFYVGFFKEQKIVPMLSIGSGLEYSQIGTMPDSDSKMQLHYLSMPVNLKVKIGPIYAIGGASASFKVGEQWTDYGKKTDVAIKANWFDVPVHVGLGVQILAFRIEARYHWGMLDLYDSPLTGYKTQAIQLGLAIAI